MLRKQRVVRPAQTIAGVDRIGEGALDGYLRPMRSACLLVAMFAFSASALGQETCVWVSEDGAQLEQVSPGEIKVTADGQSYSCQLRGTGTGVEVMAALCDVGDFPYFLVAPEAGADPSILIFQNTAWYSECR